METAIKFKIVQIGAELPRHQRPANTWLGRMAAPTKVFETPEDEQRAKLQYKEWEAALPVEIRTVYISAKVLIYCSDDGEDWKRVLPMLWLNELDQDLIKRYASRKRAP